MRIVLAVDGSPVATRAARYVARLAPRLMEKPQVVLLNVDEPLLRSVAIELGVDGVAKYHADNSRFALKTAKAVLNRADVGYDEQLMVGNPAETIVKFASAAKCDLVVMGSHGRSAFKSLFLGSVTIKVLTHCQVPVTIVRQPLVRPVDCACRRLAGNGAWMDAALFQSARLRAQRNEIDVVASVIMLAAPRPYSCRPSGNAMALRTASRLYFWLDFSGFSLSMISVINHL